MRAENYECKKKERNFQTLHKQLLDLETRYRFLQDDKARFEREVKEHEDQLYNENYDIKTQIDSYKETLDEKQQKFSNYRRGNTGPLYNVIGLLLWRSAKKDVIDQVGCLHS